MQSIVANFFLHAL